MERRQLLKVLCGVVGAWPIAAYAQQSGRPLSIGIVGANAAVWESWTAAFVARLRELGWIEGNNVAIAYRWAEGSSERVSEIAAEFLREKVNVIVTYGSAVSIL